MQHRKTINEVKEDLEVVAKKLKDVGTTLDEVIVKLRAIQHTRLQNMVTQQDLEEARTIKEVIADLESVA